MILRLLARLTPPCAVRSRPPVRRGLPYLCSLPRDHQGDHEARLWGKVVHRWPQEETR